VIKDLRGFSAAGLASAGFNVSTGSDFVTLVEDTATGASHYFGPADDANTPVWSTARRLVAPVSVGFSRELWATANHCINVTLRITGAGCRGLVELRRYLLPQIGTAVGSTICKGFAQRHAVPFQFQDSGITLFSVAPIDPMLGLLTECQAVDTPISGVTTHLLGGMLGLLMVAFATAVLW
jgi:hypothetical protein